MAGNEVSTLVKRQYENRIADLERQLNERTNAGPSKAMVERMRRQIEQRYLDLINLVKAKPSEEGDEPFRNKLLAELQEANQELECEM